MIKSEHRAAAVRARIRDALAAAAVRARIRDALAAPDNDHFRMYLRRALMRALIGADSGLQIRFKEAVKDSLGVASTPTMSAAIDRLAANAIGWAAAHALKADPDETIRLLCAAIEHPAEYSHRSKRSASGFALGHHTTWPDRPISNTTLHHISKEEVTPMTAAITKDHSHLANIVLALAGKASELGDTPTMEEMATSIPAIAKQVAAKAKLDEDGRKAIEAIALLSMDAELPKRIEEGRNHPDYKLFVDETANEEPAIEVDEAFASAIGTLLGKATGGKIVDIKVTLNELRELRHEVNVLKAKAASMPAVHITTPRGEDTVDGSKLTYEVVMQNIGDLFPSPKTGKKVKQLDFEVPALRWHDEKGTIVTHPDCDPVDENYQFSPKLVMRLATAFLKGHNVWTHGHSGAGKTTVHGQFFARLGFPVYRINLDSSLERSDLIGTETLEEKGGATVSGFREGLLPRVMTKPCVVLFDEIDYGRPEILAAVQRALEGKGLLLTEDGGRLVKPHELQRWAATANSRGQGDEFGVYPGVRPLNAAMLDRFQTMIEVEYMKTDDEVELIKKRFTGIDTKFVDQLVSFANMVRKAFINGEISTTLSPRGTLAIADLFTFHQVRLGDVKAREEAIEVVVIDRSTLDNRQRVLELASRAFS